MSFQVETTPNHFTDFEIFSANRLNQLGQQFLSLINPNHGTNQTKPDEPQAENDNPPPPPPPPIPPNVVQQPSDLCRSHQPYYVVNETVLQEIKENFLPNQTILPYIAPSITTLENDEQLTTSINDWQTTKSSTDSSRYLPSQIITIVQCRSTLTANLSQRANQPAVRLFINTQQQQQQQMSTFLDTVNEALLLEPDTIKTIWDSKGEQILDPMDVLRYGRLYFASREESITLDELHITDADLASINRLETVRSRLSQPAYFVDKPLTNENINVPSRKSTPFNDDNRRSATVQAQAMAYNDPQTFPEVFLRHYSVGEVLGDGRFSAVFECRDKATGIQLALKIIDKARCQGYEYLIENELSILRRVKHPNIIKLVEEFQNDLKYFLVFEYLSNGDLLTAVTTMNKYSEHDVALMLSQIVSALKHLHSLQIVHRDVKLENILMTNYPDQSVTLKLADFGLALSLADDSPRPASHGENLCGTPMYIAPEVIESRDYRVANDMWSVGVIAFTLLSGLAPFDGENDDEILANVVNKTIDFGLLPKTSFECRDALASLLERNPNRRMTANELLQHPWIKRELQRRMDPLGEPSSTRRRTKGSSQQQPLLTFSSVEHSHSNQVSNLGGLLGDIDEF